MFRPSIKLTGQSNQLMENSYLQHRIIDSFPRMEIIGLIIVLLDPRRLTKLLTIYYFHFIIRGKLSIQRYDT